MLYHLQVRILLGVAVPCFQCFECLKCISIFYNKVLEELELFFTQTLTVQFLTCFEIFIVDYNLRDIVKFVGVVMNLP